MTRLRLIAVGWMLVAQTVSAKEPAVDFNRDIRPILASKCFKCHGPAEQEGGLRLDLHESALGRGESGERAVVPGKPEASALLRRVTSRDENVRMPAEADPLSKGEVEKLRAWIEGGAEWKMHWAFVKPVRPNLPSGSDPAWCRNPIDDFVLSRLRRAGLAPSGEASREKLIRRLSLDLIGLPPSVAEVDAFVFDRRPNAYERLVDRLLASPRFGEKWARHWLDAARYGDSNGYQRDNRREVWAYRDWVIQAFNCDLPFDRFTIEQIAGDLLPGATLQQRIATGFNRGTLVNVEAGTDPEEERTIANVDRVNTTSTVWLGLTLECAQCHEHKYDPFTQKDYYRLYAFFNSTAEEIRKVGTRRDFIGPNVSLPISPEQAGQQKKLQAEVKRHNDRVDQAIAAAMKGQPDWEAEVAEPKSKGKAKIPAHIRKILAIEPDNRTDEQRKQLEDHYLTTVPAVKKARQQLAATEKRLQALQPPTSLAMRELDKPRMTRVFTRGDFLKPGEPVQPGTPQLLHALRKQRRSQALNRLDLARWLIDRDNPLTARVTVNRFWMQLFGRGLVATPEDFGSQGELPTHPELLDWLAVEFADGWRMKRLIRRIVTSATYRQDSRVTPRLLAADPNNVLYARGPRFRMPAEMVRDNALAVAGLLSAKPGGPPVYPYQPPGVWNHIGVTSNLWKQSTGENQYRRGVYVNWRRTVPYPSFVNFDAPSREACAVRRSRSNTPLQALTLMNDPVYVEAAAAFAERLLRERPSATPSDRVNHAFRLALSRRPRSGEFRVLLQGYEDELAFYQRNPAAAKKLMTKWSKTQHLNPAEFAAWLQVTTVLLNLDEVITKG